MKTDWKWIDPEVVLAIHDKQLFKRYAVIDQRIVFRCTDEHRRKPREISLQDVEARVIEVFTTMLPCIPPQMIAARLAPNEVRLQNDFVYHVGCGIFDFINEDLHTHDPHFVFLLTDRSQVHSG